MTSGGRSGSRSQASNRSGDIAVNCSRTHPRPQADASPAGMTAPPGNRDPPARRFWPLLCSSPATRASAGVKPAGPPADGTNMSDLLRKILYPLVLPCLVTAVWGYAWTKKYDDLMNDGAPVVTIPATGTRTLTTGCAPAFEPDATDA